MKTSKARQPSGENEILYEHRDQICFVKMNRPEKLNALDPKGWKKLTVALRKADSDRNVEVIILTGQGKSFSTGDDISVLPKLHNSDKGEKLVFECIYELVETIIHLKKPMISAVNGYAYGGGCEIVLLSDLAVASEKAIFCQPEGRIGAWPFIFAVFAPVVLGPKRANEIMLCGASISAAQALAIGLVNRVVPHEQVLVASEELAQEMTKASPLSLRMMKEYSNKVLGDRLQDLWVAGKRSLNETFRTEDFLEGSKAFLEGRPASFKGR
jgi:enoyl-CoA hydratase/3-hydroxyacyl-CoA dehydrogenase